MPPFSVMVLPKQTPFIIFTVEEVYFPSPGVPFNLLFYDPTVLGSEPTFY